jgi:hypothetical protein
VCVFFVSLYVCVIERVCECVCELGGWDCDVSQKDFGYRSFIKEGGASRLEQAELSFLFIYKVA